ncbi:uncharacterized protein LOC100187158 [Ciona intestinalis]
MARLILWLAILSVNYYDISAMVQSDPMSMTSQGILNQVTNRNPFVGIQNVPDSCNDTCRLSVLHNLWTLVNQGVANYKGSTDFFSNTVLVGD